VIAEIHSKRANSLEKAKAETTQRIRQIVNLSEEIDFSELSDKLGKR
jgi:hypothetical protein